MIDNLVILNGHFHECIEGIGKKEFSPAELHHKFSVEFADKPHKYKCDSTNGLDYLAIDFRVSHLFILSLNSFLFVIERLASRDHL